MPSRGVKRGIYLPGSDENPDRCQDQVKEQRNMMINMMTHNMANMIVEDAGIFELRNLEWRNASGMMAFPPDPLDTQALIFASFLPWDRLTKKEAAFFHGSSACGTGGAS